MDQDRVIRINKVLRELNISLDRAVDFLRERGYEIESSQKAKINQVEYTILINQFRRNNNLKLIKKYQKLKYLSIKNYKISNIESLKHLSELKILYLQTNNIGDYTI